MTDLRTAAQQALAFTMRDFASLRDFEAARAVLHDTLRAALAEPDIDPVDEYRKGFIDGQIDMRDRPKEQPEPQREPVGWFESPHGAFRANPQYLIRFPSQLLSWQIPLYTAPPQRPPLTDEEISDLFSEAVKNNKSVHWLCRAIERAVRGEKE